MSDSADLNLLFGILALQLDFISQEQLISGMNRWVLAKQRPLADILEEAGALERENRAALDAIVAAHLRRHAQDVRQSLAALGDPGGLQRELSQIGDPVLAASIPHLGANRPVDDPFRTITTGELTSTGTRFRVLRPHAQGGLGKVFLAMDQELHREVALKEIQSTYADDPAARARFTLEAEVTGSLEHPGIVPVYGLGVYPDGRPFYAMRFIKGDSLKEAIRRYHDTQRSRSSTASDRTFELRQLLGRLIDVGQAIQYAHDRGVLHRDLKPGNIMLGKYGETLVVDWGLAKVRGRATDDTLSLDAERELQPASGSSVEPTRMGMLVGTLQYMSPEQALGRLDLVGPATDVFALGATLYHVLTGQSPYAENSSDELLEAVRQARLPPPRQIRSDIPVGLEAICLKALAREIPERYSSVSDLIGDLELWLADEPIPGLAEPLAVRFQRFARKRPGVVSAVAASLIVSVVGLTTGLYFVNQEKNLKNTALRTAEHQRQMAIESSELATRRLEEKRTALDEMLAAFSDDELKGQAGSHSIRRTFLERGLEQYTSLLADQEGNQEVMLRIADTHRELGVVLKELGDSDQSLTQLTEAVKLCRTAVIAQPDDEAPQLALGEALFFLAQNLFEQQRREEARPAAAESVEVFRALRAKSPKTVEYQAKLGRSLVRQASVLADKASAEPLYDEAERLLRDAVAAEPRNAEYVLALSRTQLNRHANVSTPEAIAQTRQAIDGATRAIELRPALAVANDNRARGLISLCYKLKANQQPQQALEILTSYEPAFRQYVKDNPGVVSAPAVLCFVLNEKASLLTLLKNSNQAVVAYREVVQIQESLAERLPADPTPLVERAKALRNIQNLQSQTNPAEAQATLESLVSSADSSLQRHPHSEPLFDEFLLALSTLAWNAKTQEDYAEASRHYEAAIALIRRFPHPDEVVRLRREKNVLEMATWATEGWLRIKRYDQARELAVMGLAAQPATSDSSADMRLELRAHLAEALQGAGEVDAAIEQWQSVRDETSRMLAKVEDRIETRLTLSRSLRALAQLHRRRSATNAELAAAREFAALESYFDGVDRQALLAAGSNDAPTLASLRAAVDAPRKSESFQFTFKGSTGPVQHRLHFFAARRPLEDQFQRLQDVEKLDVAGLRDEFFKLYQVSAESNLSPVDVVVFRFASKRPDLETIQTLLASNERQYQRMRDPAQAASARQQAVRNYLAIANCYQDAELPQRGVAFLDEASLVLGTASTSDPLIVTQLRSAIARKRALMIAAYAPFEQTYNALLHAYDSQLEFVSDGLIERRLGDVCHRHHRLLEAANWYWLAAEAGNSEAFQSLAHLVQHDSAASRVLPVEVQLAFRHAAPNDATADDPDSVQRVAAAWSKSLLNRREQYPLAQILRHARALPPKLARDTMLELVDLSPATVRLALAEHAHQLGYYSPEAIAALEQLLVKPDADEITAQAVPLYLEALLVTHQAQRAADFADSLDQMGWQPVGSAGEQRTRVRVYWTFRRLAAIVAQEASAIPLPVELAAGSDDEPLMTWDWNAVLNWLVALRAPGLRLELYRQLTLACEPVLERMSTADVMRLKGRQGLLDVSGTVGTLCRGVNAKQKEFWAYVSIKPSHAGAFRQARELKQPMQLEEYGEVVEYGYGQHPPADSRDRLQAWHGFDDDFEERLLKQARALQRNPSAPLTMTDDERQKSLARDQLIRGHEALSSGDYPVALRHLQAGITSWPKNCGALYDLWYAQLRLGNREAATETLDRLRESTLSRPASLLGYCLLAESLLIAGNTTEALKLCEGEVVRQRKESDLQNGVSPDDFAFHIALRLIARTVLKQDVADVEREFSAAVEAAVGRPPMSDLRRLKEFSASLPPDQAAVVTRILERLATIKPAKKDG